MQLMIGLSTASSACFFLLSALTSAAVVPTTIPSPINSDDNDTLLSSSSTSSNGAQNPQAKIAPSLSAAQIHCDGAIYGHDITSRSCLNAYLEIASDSTLFEIQNRPSAGEQPTNALGLPYRWISGSSYLLSINNSSTAAFLSSNNPHEYIHIHPERRLVFYLHEGNEMINYQMDRKPHPRYTVNNPSVDDGLCIFDITLTPGIISDFATWNDFRRAAYRLVSDCASGGPGEPEGGRATNIGHYGHLSLTMTSYKPRVRCSGPISARGGPEGCADVFDSMPATKNLEIFGGRGEAGVEIGLPLEFENHGGACNATLSQFGAPDLESWYHVWEEMVAVNGMCARQGLDGTAFALGMRSSIVLDVRRTREVNTAKP